MLILPKFCKIVWCTRFLGEYVAFTLKLSIPTLLSVLPTCMLSFLLRDTISAKGAHPRNAGASHTGNLVTALKRSLQRLCFYTSLSVILFGGGCLPQCIHPLGADTPLLWSRHPPEQTPGADPREQTPPSCAVHAGGYRQQAGGTHPTGMHTWIDH